MHLCLLKALLAKLWMRCWFLMVTISNIRMVNTLLSIVPVMVVGNINMKINWMLCFFG